MSPPQQPFFLLHLLLLLLPHYLFLFSSPQSPPLLQLLPADREALFDIRQSLHDLPGSSFFSNWDFSSGSEPCNTFTGVICSYDSDEEPNFLQVSTLTLGTGLVDSPGLGGTLPPSITNLTALTELVVYPGRVSGPIPAEIGFRLLRLRLLSISGNRLLGPIPSSLSNLPDLHTLDLGQNHLQGPLPPSLFSSNPNLKVLLLASNGGLCGSLPHEFSDAAKLLHVDLRSNSLTGPLPPPPASLRFLSAAFNSLSGPLSPAFTTSPLPNLEFLDLSGNAFSGEVPPAIFSLPELSSLLLSRNNLSGQLMVAPQAPLSSSLSVVDISHNMLSGQPPEALATAGSLYLNDNHFTGTVPTEYINSIYSGTMTTLYAQNNFFTDISPPPPSTAIPASASLCASYNCMVPPPFATAGCPAGARGELPRPADQCSIGAGGGDD